MKVSGPLFSVGHRSHCYFYNMTYVAIHDLISESGTFSQDIPSWNNSLAKIGTYLTSGAQCANMDTLGLWWYEWLIVRFVRMFPWNFNGYFGQWSIMVHVRLTSNHDLLKVERHETSAIFKYSEFLTIYYLNTQYFQVYKLFAEVNNQITCSSIIFFGGQK